MKQWIFPNIRLLWAIGLAVLLYMGSDPAIAASLVNPWQQTTLDDHPPDGGMYLRDDQGAYTLLSIFVESDLRVWPLGNLITTTDVQPTISVFLPFRVNDFRLTRRLPGMGVQFLQQGCPYVEEVLENSPAARAGIQPGDEILAIGSEVFDCNRLLHGYDIGDTVEIYVRRNGNNQGLQVTLGPVLSEEVGGVNINQRFVPDFEDGYFLYEMTSRTPLEPGEIYCLVSDGISVSGNQTPYYCFKIAPGPRGMLSYGAPVEVELEYAEGERWTFMGTAGEQVTINLHNSGFYGNLELLDSKGERLRSGGTLIAAYPLPTDGIYTILVDAANQTDTGTYTLALYRQRAQTIAYGDTQTANLMALPAGVWQFEGNANDLISVRTDAESGSGTYIQLINGGSGATVARESQSLEFILLPDDGRYNIVVTTQSEELALTLVHTEDVFDLVQEELTFGQVYQGVINDRIGAWLRFDGRAGDLVSTVVEHLDGRLFLQLYNASETPLYADSSALRVGMLPYVRLPETGSYALRVYTDWLIYPALPFSLELTWLRSIDEGAKGELVRGEVVHEMLDSPLGHRWTFEAEAGERLFAGIVQGFGGLTIVGPDGKVVLNQNQDVIYEIADVWGWPRPVWDVEIPTTGRYTLLVMGEGGGFYALFLADWKIMEDIAGILKDRGSDEGYEDFLDGGKQRWLFYGRAGEIVTVEAQGDEFAPSLYMYTFDSDGGKNGTLLRLRQITLPVTGLYAVVVRSVDASTGRYEIALVREGVIPMDQGDLVPGQTVTATLTSSLGHRWSFQGRVGQTVGIEMSSEDLDPLLRLYAPDGEELAANDDGGDDHNARVVLDLPVDGVYTVEASGYLGQMGGYQLRVEDDPQEESMPVSQANMLQKLTESLGIDFVKVQAGEFRMGATDEMIDLGIENCKKYLADDATIGECITEEWKDLVLLMQPQHIVDLDTYWIGVTEITNAQFRPFVENGGYLDPSLWTSEGWNWRTSNEQRQPICWSDWMYCGLPQPDHPVQGISWYEAIAYANWLARETGLPVRLPTEAEWEKAAHGTDGRLFPWGNDYPNDDHANFCDYHCWIDREKHDKLDDGYWRTAPVGSYPEGSSPYGLLDMAGNVAEWTSTLWGSDCLLGDESAYPYPYNADDGREALETTDEVAACRVIRGLGWFSPPLFGISPLRFGSPADGTGLLPGLRLVVEARE